MSLSLSSFFSSVDKNDQLTIYNTGRKDCYLSKQRTITQKTASQITPRNYSREAWFSAVLFLVTTKTTKQVRYTFLQDLNKQKIITCTVSQYGLDTWNGNLFIEEVLTLVSREGKYFICIFNMGILYFPSMHPFLQ